MKFVCRNCESFMSYADLEVPRPGALGITFACDGCGARISMVTNAGETQMVKALGVTLGGSEEPARAFDVTRGSLSSNDAPAQPVVQPSMASHMAVLSDSVEGSAGKCPFANMIGTLEGEAAQGPDEVRWTEEATERLERIPAEVRPMAQKVIEMMARSDNAGLVDDDIMERAVDRFM